MKLFVQALNELLEDGMQRVFVRKSEEDNIITLSCDIYDLESDCEESLLKIKSEIKPNTPEIAKFEIEQDMYKELIKGVLLGFIKNSGEQNNKIICLN